MHILLVFFSYALDLRHILSFQALRLQESLQWLSLNGRRQEAEERIISIAEWNETTLSTEDKRQMREVLFKIGKTADKEVRGMAKERQFR